LASPCQFCFHLLLACLDQAHFPCVVCSVVVTIRLVRQETEGCIG
jgi:hypothetical protein